MSKQRMIQAEQGGYHQCLWVGGGALIASPRCHKNPGWETWVSEQSTCLPNIEDRSLVSTPSYIKREYGNVCCNLSMVGWEMKTGRSGELTCQLTLPAGIFPSQWETLSHTKQVEGPWGMMLKLVFWSSHICTHPVHLTHKLTQHTDTHRLLFTSQALTLLGSKHECRHQRHSHGWRQQNHTHTQAK